MPPQQKQQPETTTPLNAGLIGEELDEEPARFPRIKFTDEFYPPIFYSASKRILPDHVIADLELFYQPNDDTPDNGDAARPSSVYAHLMTDHAASPFDDTLVPHLAKYYTTDTVFLKQTQTLLKTLPVLDSTAERYTECDISKLWNEIGGGDFLNQYNYVEWSMFSELNRSETFLGLSSVYTIASPAVSLATPIVCLIIPLIILKYRGVNIDISEYIAILKQMISGHSISRLFTDLGSGDFSETVYILLSAAFYVFSIYQNIMACIKFHANMTKIHAHLATLIRYINVTASNMKAYLKCAQPLETYAEFSRVVFENLCVLTRFKEAAARVVGYSFSFKKLLQLGQLMKCFYELYDSTEYDHALRYSFGFNSYIETIRSTQRSVARGYLAFATLRRDSTARKNIIRGGYHASLKSQTPVKNTVRLNKNIILTGANAAGKTTLLKSVLVNVILTQQLGVGFYDSAVITPYKHIHCYLNIPDTSNRDSLFQAEARRCKDILDFVRAPSSKGELHLCGFDELYSGTNPEEAAESATAFIKYLSKFRHVSSILTTHYTDVCTALDSNERVDNYCMRVEEAATAEKGRAKGGLKYTYKLKKGISETKGGMTVLRDMNYPVEISG